MTAGKARESDEEISSKRNRFSKGSLWEQKLLFASWDLSPHLLNKISIKSPHLLLPIHANLKIQHHGSDKSIRRTVSSQSTNQETVNSSPSTWNFNAHRRIRGARWRWTATLLKENRIPNSRHSSKKFQIHWERAEEDFFFFKAECCTGSCKRAAHCLSRCPASSIHRRNLRDEARSERHSWIFRGRGIQFLYTRRALQSLPAVPRLGFLFFLIYLYLFFPNNNYHYQYPRRLSYRRRNICI